MKKAKGNAIFLFIVAALLLIGSIAYLVSAAGVGDDIETFPAVGWVGIIVAIVCAVVGVIKLTQNSDKNVHTVEATFLSIGKYGDGWVGCYFDVDGKETRIAIMSDVFNPKLLMPGAKYKITRRNKDNDVVGVERID